MAYDRVIDSSVLDAGLKQIADAIREKAGVSGEFYFPTDFAEMIKAIQAGGGNSLWNGGKFTMGSFVLTEEVTSEYVIATSSDDAILGLLNDGEELPSVYASIGLFVVIKPWGSDDDSVKAGVLGSSACFPVYFVDTGGASAARYYQYWDKYQSLRATTGGANVSYNKLSINFTSSAKGSPNFEYLWLAWRGVV